MLTEAIRSFYETEIAGETRSAEGPSGKPGANRFGDWTEYLGNKSEALHPDYVSRIGNLTLFAGPLRHRLPSNDPYERKKFAYKESAIKLTNSLIDEYPEFKFEQVDDRSAKLADLAVALWPIP